LHVENFHHLGFLHFPVLIPGTHLLVHLDGIFAEIVRNQSSFPLVFLFPQEFVSQNLGDLVLLGSSFVRLVRGSHEHFGHQVVGVFLGVYYTFIEFLLHGAVFSCNLNQLPPFFLCFAVFFFFGFFQLIFQRLPQILLFFTTEFCDGFLNLLFLPVLALDIRTVSHKLILILSAAFLFLFDFIF
jgi:hypothetical protein